MTDQQLSEEIKVALIRAQVSQRELAERIGLTPTQLSRRLSGSTHWMASEIAAVSKALGVPVGVLYGPLAAA